MKSVVESLKIARKVGTPLVGIQTPDQPALAHAIAEQCADEPILQWDLVRGMLALNEAGADVLAEVQQLAQLTNPADMLAQVALVLPARTCLLGLNFQRFLDAPDVTQGLANLRESFKDNGRTFVLLGPGFTFPPELQQDIYLLVEPLPAPDELAAILARQHEYAELKVPTRQALEPAIDAVRGLSAYAAEQVTALSLTRKGLNLAGLWERKRAMIEQTPGLSCWRGPDSFSTLGGLEALKGFLRRVNGGPGRPRAVVWLDEIEKAVAGSSGSDADSSGVSQDMLLALLSAMQDTDATGVILIGPPGTGKSGIAKAFGNEAGCPTIAFDLGAMKAGLVGASETNIRRANLVVDAVSDKRAFYIATCNSIAQLPPELRRRFTLGTWFVDLPSPEEQQLIWEIYERQFKVSGQRPPHDGWTGAEIKSACHIAWLLQCSLLEAAQYIVPVAKAAEDQIGKLRTEASGRFLAANRPGLYQAQALKTSVPKGGRQFMLN